jgi:hypothetical protein
MNVIRKDILSWEMKVVEICHTYFIPPEHQRSLMPWKEI